jgi:hypothetical protein
MRPDTVCFFTVNELIAMILLFHPFSSQFCYSTLKF